MKTIGSKYIKNKPPSRNPGGLPMKNLMRCESSPRIGV